MSTSKHVHEHSTDVTHQLREGEAVFWAVIHTSMCMGIQNYEKQCKPTTGKNARTRTSSGKVRP